MQLTKESSGQSAGEGRSKAVPAGEWSTHPHDCTAVPGLPVLPLPALLLPALEHEQHVPWRVALKRSLNLTLENK